ncbi:ATP-binding protein [Thermoleptolyngbya sp. C42_A2020_037]|uniref:sensor histidine kinase n=1 Tax=Thermoleptolyngbya sp. C42_A2020_037 TaxID=2747799 RepID=UPI0019EA3595|nr:ATP-binding protein [Thermoleptolyngbya sp. C42_A2020_037]MBF2086053.1 GHKL domain-containing protein [Thermoleptolyngbya sp. C42_A2020_037]
MDIAQKLVAVPSVASAQNCISSTPLRSVECQESSEPTPAQRLAALEKENRILRKKLERSERDRQILEANMDRSENLMRNVIAELEASRSSLARRGQELEQTLSQLQQAQVQLIEAEKMSALGTLVAGIAHEINNPMGFVHGNVNYTQTYVQELLRVIAAYQDAYPIPTPGIQALLEEIDLEFLQQDVTKVLQSMQMGTKRISDIVRSLRTFSRLDEADFKDADLHEGLESTLMILQHRLKACGDLPEIEIIKDFEPLPLVECYPGKLNQVFMNLLTNAIDAVQERYRQLEGPKPTPQITLKTRQIGDSVAIHVIDNGIGIAEGHLPRLFNPFFTTKPVGQGVGLGLSISYQIVTDQHHGQLVCRSKLNEGTEFIIQIPRRQSHPVATNLPGR